VFADRQANEARMRAEWVMKQREHEVLDKVAVLKKLSPPEQCVKLQKRTNEATLCFRILTLRRAGE
jgi:hypothetical protein